LKFKTIIRKYWNIRNHNDNLGCYFFYMSFKFQLIKLGSEEAGGPFSLLELKVIQEIIALFVLYLIW
jgi:hypothetical protein